MPSLKDLRDRIDSVQSTKKITSAMKLVAGARLKKAQTEAESSRPYASKMQTIIDNVTSNISNLENAPEIIKGKENNKTHLIVLMTSDRGLCGGFNTAITKMAKKKIKNIKNSSKNVKILCVGKKGYDHLKREFNDSIIDSIPISSQKKIDYEFAKKISKKILLMYENEEFDVAHIVFSLFKSAIKQEAQFKQILPVLEDKDSDSKKNENNDDSVYEYEPEEEEVLKNLVPQNIAIQIFSGLLENAAGEQGARMTAMDNATRNAGELIDTLKLNYNRSRQAQITNELIEVISGAEAV
ncbi:MAG: ATP synthase gamma chain [Alphaproteobacteria bacterium MarineAlpha6_Bin3]|nr:MAG: ATP synthase gamma chain [Alphaproteobacteria bacterium MarineAlpha6_Bin3]|tara:strand:+ start:6221 stop:7111 length:891 start_codon:yes stop_codon:yes gene_type:complete